MSTSRLPRMSRFGPFATSTRLHRTCLTSHRSRATARQCPGRPPSERFHLLYPLDRADLLDDRKDLSCFCRSSSPDTPMTINTDSDSSSPAAGSRCTTSRHRRTIYSIGCIGLAMIPSATASPCRNRPPRQRAQARADCVPGVEYSQTSVGLVGLDNVSLTA